jgi:hypothetical protein
MTIRILHGDVHLIDLTTRLPFKYGIATMTRAPQAFVRLQVEIDGQPSTGVAADILPPKWFTKVADKPLDVEIDEMLDVIDHAVAAAAGVAAETVFDAWRQVFKAQLRWGHERNYPSLLTQFGTTLVERALIEAYCRALKRPFAAVVRDNELGIRLGHFDQRLADADGSPDELLPRRPRRSIIARHTVGMADPLEDSDIEPAARLDDDLPQSLAESIRRYGLKHFKIKLSGNAQPDIERLARVAAVIDRNIKGEFAFSLDGNESFRSFEAFRSYWETVDRAQQPSRFFSRLMFVEQPFHRDVALDADVLGGLTRWNERPRLIIDESDAEIDSLARALEIGYHGTSHKNCKGVFKGIANACLLELLRSSLGADRLVMSGEDLANIGPVALLQDLAVVATLGVASVERNGHHYFSGLSAFPRSVQEQVLAAHGDLYERSSRGWPTLHISDGELKLDSVVDAPFGVGFEIDVSRFTPRAEWSTSRFFGEGTK